MPRKRCRLKISERIKGFPGGSDSKESMCSAGDLHLIPQPGRSPGEGNGYPLQYSCLENSMDVVFCPMSESPGGKRESFQDNAIRKKGSLLLTRARAFCHNQRSGAGSEESPEQRLLPKFIRYA